MLFYTNQSNFILPDHHLEIGNEAKSHVIETLGPVQISGYVSHFVYKEKKFGELFILQVLFVYVLVIK